MAFFAAYSVHLKKDTDWDFRNYHYYGCYCLEKGRLGYDILAAQLQSYLDPVAYLPYCWAVDHLKPVAVGILFGALAGLNLALLYELAWTALAGLAQRRRAGLALLAAVAGIYSPLFLFIIGSSCTDAWTPLLVLLGLLAVLRDARSPSRWLLFAAGVALGAATGFKLVNGVFALALLLTIGATFRRPGFFRRLAAYCAGAVIAILLVSGPWSLALQREFGSPMFPFYNRIFHSPYYPAINFTDNRWRVRTLTQALDHPLHWAAEQGTLSAEFPFRDLRFAVFAILLLPALAVSFRRQKTTDPQRQPLFDPALRDLLLCFFVFAYLLWIFVFGHMRYAAPIALLSSLGILALCDCLLEQRAAKQRVFVVLALMGIVWMRMPQDPRPGWGQTWFEVSIPGELRSPKTLYVMPDSAASAYIVPFLPADSRFVRLDPNDSPVPPDRYLGPRILSLIQNHSGPLRILEVEKFNVELLAGYGLTVNLNDCLAIQTYADQINVCSAYRTASGANSTVALGHFTRIAQQTASVYSHELLINNDFGQGLTDWETGGPVEVLPAQHALRVTAHQHAHQFVRVTPGTAYHVAVRARCPEPDTYTRLQVNWVDSSGRLIGASLTPLACTNQWVDYSTTYHAPPQASGGLFYVTGHSEKPVLIQNVSMAW
jgi:hypothetical protein